MIQITSFLENGCHTVETEAETRYTRALKELNPDTIFQTVGIRLVRLTATADDSTRSTVMILDTVRTTAIQFQIENNLDRTEIPNLLKHDYIHATLGLMVSQAEEELVEAIEGVLDFGQTWNTQALELARSLPAEFRALYRFGSI